MPGLNLHTDEPRDSKKSKNKMLKVVLGIGVLIAVPVIGTTLAASISINTGTSNQVQFGQGVSQAVACDSDIVVTPYSSFTNGTTSGTFKLSSIKVSGIADACDGRTFTIKVYDNTANASPQTIATGTTTGAIGVVYNKASTWSTVVPTTNATVSQSVAGDFTVTLNTVLDAGSVNKITVETS